MARPSITLDDRIADPYFCEDRDDFYKMCLASCQAFTDNFEDSEYFSFFIRVLCHEYLALVLSKKLEPYEMGEEVVENEKSGFKEAIGHVNELITSLGIPTFEGEDGKIKIDHDELKRRVQEEEDGE